MKYNNMQSLSTYLLQTMLIIDICLKMLYLIELVAIVLNLAAILEMFKWIIIGIVSQGG